MLSIIICPWNIVDLNLKYNVGNKEMFSEFCFNYQQILTNKKRSTSQHGVFFTTWFITKVMSVLNYKFLSFNYFELK